MRLSSGYILPRNASNFTCSHLDLKFFLLRRNPRAPAYRGGEGKRKRGEGLKGSYLLKWREERAGDGEREWKVGAVSYTHLTLPTNREV